MEAQFLIRNLSKSQNKYLATMQKTTMLYSKYFTMFKFYL